MKVMITHTDSEGTSLNFRMVEGNRVELETLIKKALRRIVFEMSFGVGDTITIKEYLK